MGQLEGGAYQPGQIGVHIHRRQQQLLGVGVVGVVVKVALGLLDAVDAAPDGGFPQGQVVDVLDAVKGQRVKHHQPFQLVLVFLHLFGVVKQGGQQLVPCPQHRKNPNDQQHRHHQPQCLAPAAAVDPCVFLRGNITSHDVSVSCLPKNLWYRALGPMCPVFTL